MRYIIFTSKHIKMRLAAELRSNLLEELTICSPDLLAGLRGETGKESGRTGREWKGKEEEKERGGKAVFLFWLVW